MKKYLLSLLAAVALCGLFLGCEGCNTAPGRYDPTTHTYDTNAPSDPIVVTAQKTRAQALDTFDLLWATEFQFRDQLYKLNPEIKKVTDYTRANAKSWLDALTADILAYQTNRTPDNKIKLDGAIKILEQAIGQAKDFVAQAQKLTIAPPVAPTPPANPTR